jgi:hypothetical protein
MGGFKHLVLLGGSPDLQQLVLQAGLARSVSTVLPAGCSADALVRLHDAGTPLTRAVQCLAPGGVLYYEVDRRRDGLLQLPQRAARMLRRAGFTVSGVYWVTPNFRRRQAYIPLDHPRALLWYLCNHATDAKSLQTASGTLLPCAGGIGSATLGLSARCFAVTAVLARPERAPLPSVLASALPPVLEQSCSGTIILTPGRNDWPRIVYLPFADHGQEPFAALKFPRCSALSEDIHREQTVLQSLQKYLQPDMASTVPVPLGLFRWNDIPVSLESFIPGRELKTFAAGAVEISHDRQIQDLRRAAAWLTEFNRQVVVECPVWSPEMIMEHVEEPLAQYEWHFRLTPDERLLFDDVRTGAYTLSGASLPITWSHGDLAPKNIHSAGDKIVVLDWASSRISPPLFDLLYFVNVWYFFVRYPRGDGDPQQCFQELFFGPRPRDDAVREVRSVVRAYLDALGINRGFLPLLFVLVWVDFALNEVHGRPWREARNIRGNPDPSRKYVQFVQYTAQRRGKWLAEICSW